MIKRVIARLDFESISELDLFKDKCGPYKYAEHPSTQVNMLSWKYSDSEDVYTWTRWRPDQGLDDLKTLALHIARGDIVKSHNVEFEYAMWNYCFIPQLIKTLKFALL